MQMDILEWINNQGVFFIQKEEEKQLAGAHVIIIWIFDSFLPSGFFF